MTGNNRKQFGRQTAENDAFDCELDAALSKYGAVEPRAGLEERILANLRAERDRATRPGWWGLAAVVFAMALILAVGRAWISHGPPSVVAEHQRSTPTQNLPSPQPQLARNSTDVGPPRRAHRAPNSGVHHAPVRVKAVARPRLDRFPSPQPLSEQEKILAEYVADHHRQAVLIARARVAALKQDLEEELAETSAGINGTIPESPANQQTDR